MRENYYLSTYLPLLNTLHISSSKTRPVIAAPNKLFDFLKKIQKEIKSEQGMHRSLKVWVYKLTASSDNLEFIGHFPSILATHRELGIKAEYIKYYLNTNIPRKDYLFYSEPLDIKNFSLTVKRVTELLESFPFLLKTRF